MIHVHAQERTAGVRVTSDGKAGHGCIKKQNEALEGAGREEEIDAPDAAKEKKATPHLRYCPIKWRTGLSDFSIKF